MAPASMTQLALHLAASDPAKAGKVKEGCPLTVGLLQQGCGIPSLSAAAKRRKARLQAAVHSDPEGVPWLEPSELGEIARRHVHSWAAGLTSGHRCLLELGLCSMASQLTLEQSRRQGKISDAVHEHVTSLWVVGVPGLWHHEMCLQALVADLQGGTPAQLLQEAWSVVEFECGAAADTLHPDEINLALRRLSMRARQDTDPSAFVRVQLWQELLYVEAGAGSMLGHGSDEDYCIDDSSIFRRVHVSDANLRAEAQSMAPEQLIAEVAQLETYAAQVLQMELWLHHALEGWQKPDAYRLLGIQRSALLSEVRRAFHKLALQRHPDKGGAKEEFQKLQQAYEDILAERGARHSCGDDDDDDDEEPYSSPQKQTPKSKGAGDSTESNENHKQEKPRSSPPEEKPGVESTQGTESPGSCNAEAAGDEVDAGDCLNYSDEHMASLSAAAQAAAEDAGEYATAALRHCQIGAEAMSGSQPQWNRAKANMHAALKKVHKVVASARLTGVQAGRVAGLLEAKGEVHLHGRAMEEFEEAGRTAAEAAVAVNASIEQCSRAADVASTVLQQLEGMGGLSADLGALFSDAIDQLAEMAKACAIAAIQAAEAASKSAGTAMQHEGMAESEREVQQEDTDPDGAQQGKANRRLDDSDKTHGEGSGADAESATASLSTDVQQQNTEGVKKSKEVCRAEAAFLSACQLLRQVNRELLELQHQARRLASSDATILPCVPVRYREDTFILMAEFLDEGAAKFHDILNASAKGNGGGFPDVCGACVSDTIDCCFGFLLHTSANLAVPADARMQTLRAAVTLDMEAVKLLLAQLCGRLEGSITAALLESNGGSCFGKGICAAAASPASVSTLLAAPMARLREALESLSHGLQASD